MNHFQRGLFYGTSIATILFALQCVAASRLQEGSRDGERDDPAPREWLVVARAHAIEQISGAEVGDDRVFAGEEYSVRIEHVEVIVGPSKDYRGPRRVVLRVSSVPYLQGGEIYLVIEERPSGDAIVKEWSRVMRQACVRPESVPRGYESVFYAARNPQQPYRCIPLDFGRIEPEAIQ